MTISVLRQCGGWLSNWSEFHHGCCEVLYEQVEGVAMGSSLGILLANTFWCSREEKLDEKNELPSFYKRYVYDTLTIRPDLNEANIFLDKLNPCHGNLKFTMEIAEQNTNSFVDIKIRTKSGNRPETSVYRKSTNVNVEKLIIDKSVYRGSETKNL